MNLITRRLAFACLAVFPWTLAAADALTWQEKEEFLLKAKIVKATESKKGVTNTIVVTLSDGKITHDASVQTIDERKSIWLGEVNFKDSYRFYIAAWRLARTLGLEDMVPPSVKRKYRGTDASFTWWIDDVMMDQADMLAKKVTAPSPNDWNKEQAMVKVFDALIYNMDRNQTNLLISKEWHTWMIDHGRSFRNHKTLKEPHGLTQIDRKLLAALKGLDEPTLKKEFDKDRLVTSDEMRGLLARRDVIVQFFEQKGEAGLFDRPVRP